MTIKLRPLQLKDIPHILEWMNDSALNQFFQQDFTKMTTEKETTYITQSWHDQNNQHFAITNKTDEYLGTISLKNINLQHRNAEYAIALRQKAIGTGVAQEATIKLLTLAFTKLKLHKVYLNVLSDNLRACRFYEKIGFIFEGETKAQIYLNDKFHDLTWYGLTKDQWQKTTPFPPFKRLSFSQLGDERGHLVVAEVGQQIPFAIRRVFYIYGSDKNVIRGQHANRHSQFVLINIQGQSKVKIDTGVGESTVVKLTHSHQGVYLNKMVWKEMYDFSPDSILLCLASENYQPEEYIRDYQQFLKTVNSKPSPSSSTTT
jgi:diamine N-acetyltransferase